MNKAPEASPDPIADNRSSFDHKTGKLSEPEVGSEERVTRHSVDPKRDIEPEEGQDPNGPVPRRADPFAHQRDKKAAEAGNKEEVKKDEKADKAAKNGDKDK